MILPDDTPPSPTKTQQLLAQDSSNNPYSPEHQSAPPAYPGYASYQEGQPIYTPQNPAPVPPQPPPIVPDIQERGEPAGKRFLKAFGVAVLIWTLIGMFTSSAVEVGRYSRHRGRVRPDFPLPRPGPEEGRVIQCLNDHFQWPRKDGSLMASFDLPISSRVLYLFSRGTFPSGTVSIVQDSSVSNDTVAVSVVPRNWNPELLSTVSICSLERKPWERGIGFFSPPHWSPRRPGFKFDVTVRLPMSYNNQPIQISKFETNLPQYSHQLLNPRDSVIFDSLDLHTSNAPINAESVYANHAVLETSNSPITGSFASSTTLTLITSNSPINVNVDLFNDDSRDDPTSLTMKTSNSNLISYINLISTSNSSTDGAFNVSAQTTNGALSITNPSAPLYSDLHLTSSTTNSPISIILSAAYEGSFDIQSTSSSQRSLIYDPHAKDPRGNGRERFVSYKNVGHVLEGSTNWGWEDGTGSGSVWVKTSNSAAVLKLL